MKENSIALNLLRGFRLLKGDVRVENCTDHADVEANEIESGEYVVATNIHSDIGYDDVL